MDTYCEHVRELLQFLQNTVDTGICDDDISIEFTGAEGSATEGAVPSPVQAATTPCKDCSGTDLAPHFAQFPFEDLPRAVLTKLTDALEGRLLVFMVPERFPDTLEPAEWARMVIAAQSHPAASFRMVMRWTLMVPERVGDDPSQWPHAFWSRWQCVRAVAEVLVSNALDEHSCAAVRMLALRGLQATWPKLERALHEGPAWLGHDFRESDGGENNLRLLTAVHHLKMLGRSEKWVVRWMRTTDAKSHSAIAKEIREAPWGADTTLRLLLSSIHVPCAKLMSTPRSRTKKRTEDKEGGGTRESMLSRMIQSLCHTGRLREDSVVTQDTRAWIVSCMHTFRKPLIWRLGVCLGIQELCKVRHPLHLMVHAPWLIHTRSYSTNSEQGGEVLTWADYLVGRLTRPQGIQDMSKAAWSLLNGIAERENLVLQCLAWLPAKHYALMLTELLGDVDRGNRFVTGRVRKPEARRLVSRMATLQKSPIRRKVGLPAAIADTITRMCKEQEKEKGDAIIC